MGNLLHVGAQVKCFHGVPALRLTGMPKVTLGGQQVWTVESTLRVAPGCPFTVGTKVQPCAGVEWKLGLATRVKAGGKAVVLRESALGALCKSAEGIPQGVPSVTSSQTRVRGL
jgi:hypothetical protein